MHLYRTSFIGRRDNGCMDSEHGHREDGKPFCLHGMFLEFVEDGDFPQGTFIRHRMFWLFTFFVMAIPRNRILTLVSHWCNLAELVTHRNLASCLFV